MGRIGQKIAKVAKSLGMVIHYHNRSKLSADKEDGATYHNNLKDCLLYTSPSPRDMRRSRMPSSA